MPYLCRDMITRDRKWSLVCQVHRQHHRPRRAGLLKSPSPKYITLLPYAAVLMVALAVVVCPTPFSIFSSFCRSIAFFLFSPVVLRLRCHWLLDESRRIRMSDSMEYNHFRFRVGYAHQVTTTRPLGEQLGCDNEET